jgi:hypothetical protein
MNGDQNPFQEYPERRTNDPLRERFPEMQPVRKAPGLSTVNGIGLAVYGARDFDAETGTYVKTHVFCVLFIPIFALGAYRVADAHPGWYFLGRVPLSALAKLWNFLVLFLIVGGAGAGWWVHHTGTPEYQAGRKIAEADELAEEGKLAAAAERYRDVALGKTSHAAQARTKLSGMLDAKAAQVRAEEAAKAFAVAVDLHKSGRAIERLYERGMAIAAQHADKDPRGALAVADAVAPLAPPDGKELVAFRLPLLERLAAQDPNDLGILSDLALMYEAKRDFARCEKLLAPHAAQLGDREGARILGQIYARQDKIQPAYDLLEPYARERLKRWAVAEKARNDAVKQSDDEAIAELKTGKAPDFNYKRHKSSNKETQDRMVQEYLNKRLKDHPGFRRAVESFQKEARVVPVALDLGVLQLRRGQGMADPKQRRQELERAEKTFLSVRSAVGQNQDFQLFLGQVYYWLGRHDEGRKLFDELLAAQKERTETLLTVAAVLREVGVVSEARKLAEKAWEKETQAKFKHSAAHLRSVISLDLDDRILWLERSETNEPIIKADLETAQADKAFLAGDDEEAARRYREGAQTYAGVQPENHVSLNNSALAYQGLYHATGDREAWEKGLANLEKALSLKPSDSILLQNVAENHLQRAMWDVIGNKIDLRALKRTGSLDLLAFLYQDAAGQAKYRDKLRSEAELVKVQAMLERLRVLAPKKASVYSSLLRIYSFTRELKKLKELERSLQENTLDLVDANRQTMENYQGKNDAKFRKDLQGTAPRMKKSLEAARKVGGTTLAVAAQDVITVSLTQDSLGQPANARELVALAEEAHKASPSIGTEGLLIQTLLQRAHQELIKKEPAYAKLAAKAARSLGATYLIAVALAREGPAQKAALAHADVQRVNQLLQDRCRRFPTDADPWTWAMLKAAQPEEAERLAKIIKTDELTRVERTIGLKTSPLGAALTYREHWALLIDGKEAEARSVLEALAKQGVPMP